MDWHVPRTGKTPELGQSWRSAGGEVAGRYSRKRAPWVSCSSMPHSLWPLRKNMMGPPTVGWQAAAGPPFRVNLKLPERPAHSGCPAPLPPSPQLQYLNSPCAPLCVQLCKQPRSPWSPPKSSRLLSSRATSESPILKLPTVDPTARDSGGPHRMWIRRTPPHVTQAPSETAPSSDPEDAASAASTSASECASAQCGLRQRAPRRRALRCQW